LNADALAGIRRVFDAFAGGDPRALFDVIAEMKRTYNLRVASFGHAGDGNIHVNVTGVPDDLRGEVIDAFVALKAGYEPSDELHRELLQTVRRELGPVAVIGHLSVVAMLPKTRSGKIMRRVLKAVALDRDPGDISTIEDEGSVDEARRAVEEMRAGIVT
jgi:acyl-CoA synthetase (AMP-forming)/AMP-acid ligase II